MERDRRQNFLQGAMVLTAATVAARLIGALFRIPLANILGGVGMSYYVSAYDIFTPIYSMTVTGFGVALSRLVSERAGRPGEAEAALRAAKRIFLAIGLGGAALLALASGGFTRLIRNPGAFACVLAIAPAIVFTCLSAAYRGYYQGLSNMIPTARSQVTEAFVKLLAGTALSWGVDRWLTARYLATGEVLGQAFAAAEDAAVYITRYSAAGAILGVTVSTAAGTVCIAAMYRRQRRTVRRAAAPALPGFGRALVRIALPISLSTLVVNLSALVDLSTVMNCLHAAVERSPEVISAMFGGLLPAGVTAELIPEYLYGSYSGLAFSVFNLAPALTAALGVSAIPAVTGAWARFDRPQLDKTVSSILRITLLVALPAGAGIFALPYPILALLYPTRLMECAIVAPILRVMGISTVLVAVSTPVVSILQATGKERLPLFAMLAGAAVKLTTNYLLVSRPEINIYGVPFGTLLCYSLIITVCSVALARHTGVRVGVVSVVLKPLLCAAACGVSALLVYRVCPFSGAGRTLLAVAAGAAVYFAGILLCGAVTQEDLEMLKIGRA